MLIHPINFFHSICCFSFKTCIIICPSLVKYSLYSYRCLLPILSYLISFMSSFSIYHQIIIMLPSCLCCWLCTLYLPVKDLLISNVSLVEHSFSFMHVPLWLLWNHNIHKITKHIYIQSRNLSLVLNIETNQILLGWPKVQSWSQLLSFKFDFPK